MWGRTYLMAAQAIAKLDDHIKSDDERFARVDKSLTAVGETLKEMNKDQHARHEENIKSLNRLKTSAMWTLIVVMASILGWAAMNLFAHLKFS